MEHPATIAPPAAPRGLAMAGWFAFGVRLFAVALPMGALVAALGPVEFVRWLGAVALVGSALGLAFSLAGLRLESPSRWRALQSAVASAITPVRQSR